jgi:GNAT superfamily N-acetyltransferase
MPYEIEISPVAEAEYPLIRVLANAVFEPFAPKDRPDIEPFLTPASLHVLAHLEGNPLGFIIAGPVAGRDIEIRACGVLPEYRRQGVGTRLMRHVEGFARGQGKDTVFTAHPIHQEMIRLARERHYEREDSGQAGGGGAGGSEANARRFRLQPQAAGAS